MSEQEKLAALATPSIQPPLHKRFAPAALANRAFRELVRKSGLSAPLVIGLERGDGSISVYRTECFDEGAGSSALNLPYAERLVKFLLWQRGGWRVVVGGPRSVGEHIRQVYSPQGARAFDYDFMGGVYEHTFMVEITDRANSEPYRVSPYAISNNRTG